MVAFFKEILLLDGESGLLGIGGDAASVAFPSFCVE